VVGDSHSMMMCTNTLLITPNLIVEAINGI